MFIPDEIRGGIHGLLSSVRGSFRPTPIASVSTLLACGRYCPRTLEPAPSAPTNTSPVDEVPTAKKALTFPPQSARTARTSCRSGQHHLDWPAASHVNYKRNV
jgi:hypothetical protein